MRYAIFHVIFDIGGGGGAFFLTKNNALFVKFVYAKNNAFSVTFLYEKTEHFAPHFNEQKTMHFELHLYIYNLLYSVYQTAQKNQLVTKNTPKFEYKKYN